MQNAGVSFYHSGPVFGEGFVGREEELDTILRWLGTTPPHCVAINGPPRIGKSSLLRQLCKVSGPSRYPHYRWGCIDLQGVFSPDEFFEEIVRQMGGEEESIRAILCRPPVYTVLCLDEFDKTYSRESFNADFYDFLRSLT